MHGDQAMTRMLDQFKFDTVLDVGCGAGVAAHRFAANGKRVTGVDMMKRPADFPGEYVRGRFDAVCEGLGKFDAVWCSHVIEHVQDTHAFLVSLINRCRRGGLIALTVPPAKDEIVGGHVNLYNPGLLIYNLVLSGLDCSKLAVWRYGYNISVLGRVRRAVLPPLAHDHGDIEKLAAFFPGKMYHGKNGHEVLA